MSTILRQNDILTSGITAEVPNSTVSGTWVLGAGATWQATYADLAERYEADAVYEPGTVLVFGGEKEVTTTDVRAHIAKAGVVSTNPAYVLNALAGNDETHPLIALKGRIPCKVIGKVKKGDALVTSFIKGFAETAFATDNTRAIIGIALQDKDDDGAGVIEIAV